MKLLSRQNLRVGSPSNYFEKNFENSCLRIFQHDFKLAQMKTHVKLLDCAYLLY